MPNETISRRGFLIAITGSAVAAAAGCRPTNAPPAPTLYVPGSDPKPITPTAPPPTSVPVANAPRDPLFGKLTYDSTILTDVSNLYVTQYDYNNTPEVDAATWTFTVDGLVNTPQTYSLEAIKALPAHEDMRVLECISNPVGGTLIGNLMWKGVLFEQILSQVGLKADATHARFYAADGYETSVALEWITQPNVLLAYEMNGEPLTTVHGFPLRIHMPGLYGQKMPRWLTRIEFIDYEFEGFWESRGWSKTAAIKTKSIIRQPTDNDPVQSGTVVVLQGVAVAGKRAIRTVEVQIEGGDWLPATIKAPAEDSPLAWTQWWFEYVIPAPGAYQFSVRATDETGYTQMTVAEGVFGGAFPDGTDKIHRVSIRSQENS
ncbi:MAG: molybdopterin-dependent oxidoreductase [Anaerolineales bacterium]|nr:molybdopterin-dependent oxidoreductase [Anaerolineales bacterium]